MVQLAELEGTDKELTEEDLKRDLWLAHELPYERDLSLAKSGFTTFSLYVFAESTEWLIRHRQGAMTHLVAIGPAESEVRFAYSHAHASATMKTLIEDLCARMYKRGKYRDKTHEPDPKQ